MDCSEGELSEKETWTDFHSLNQEIVLARKGACESQDVFSRKELGVQVREKTVAIIKVGHQITRPAIPDGLTVPKIKGTSGMSCPEYQGRRI